jgi:hypothetical protein
MCQSDNCDCVSDQGGCGGRDHNQLSGHDISTLRAVGAEFNLEPVLPSQQEWLNKRAMIQIQRLMARCSGLAEVMAAEASARVPTYQLLDFLLTPHRHLNGLPPLMWLWAGCNPEPVIRRIQDDRLVV